MRARSPRANQVVAAVSAYVSGFEGHSYGGNLIQKNQFTNHIINIDNPNAIAFFYEKVTEVVKESPFKTEIFAEKMKNFFSAVAPVEEVPILTLGAKPFPSTNRTIEGHLGEGPRPRPSENSWRVVLLDWF